MVCADPGCRDGQQGERQQQEAGGEARHGGHPHVRHLLAAHTADPPAEVGPAVPGDHPQHLHTGQSRSFCLQGRSKRSPIQFLKAHLVLKDTIQFK